MRIFCLRILAAVATTAAAWLAAPYASRADVINNYVLSGVSTVINSIPYNVSGSFTFDITSRNQTNVFLSVASNSIDAQFSGIYAETLGNNSSNNFIAAPSGNNFMFITFENALDISPDNLAETIFQVPNMGIQFTDNSPTGAAIFATTSAPEPSALALLGTAFAGLFLIGRRLKEADRK